MKTGKRVLFIDRDGTLVEEPPVDYQLDSLEKLVFVPKVMRALYFVRKQLDFEFVMVSNQDGLGTDSFPESSFWPAHNMMMNTLAGEGVTFDEVLIDPSLSEEHSPNRKPRLGMLGKYLTDEYDLAHSYVIGDRLTDAQLPIATPTPSPTATPTPMPDFTPAPPTPKPTAVQKLSPPVRGEVIWGFAVNELIYSRTLDQWTTHTGVDVAAPKGSEVYAVFAGTVTEIFTDDSLGVMVEVKGANDMIAVYGNLKAEPPVKVGARINAGDIVGYVGDTAVSECGDKSHVHFELLKDEKYVDPQSYVLFIKELEG